MIFSESSEIREAGRENIESMLSLRLLSFFLFPENQFGAENA